MREQLVKAKGKECEHEGVPLLAPLALSNLMNSAFVVSPKICRVPAIKHAHKRQQAGRMGQRLQLL